MRAAHICAMELPVFRVLPSAAVVLACLAAPFVAMPAHAQQKGDQWEVTVKMEMPGMSMPARTVRMCLDKRAKDDAFVPQGRGECKVTDSKRSGSTVRYHMECSGKDALAADGEMTWGTDTYSGRMRMTGKSGGDGFEMSQTFAGRKLGECSDPVNRH
jgi:uncharacterized protein DUF3617